VTPVNARKPQFKSSAVAIIDQELLSLDDETKSASCSTNKDINEGYYFQF